ncbi:MAG: multicopper oxidase family protein [Bacteroidales bacterium]
MNRKEFLKYSGLGALALGLTPSLYCTGPGPQKQLANPGLKPTENFNPDLEVELTAVTDEVQILPGEKTRVYTYLVKVTHGDQSLVATVNNSYIGPVLRVRRGQKIRINFHNQLSQESIIHWHGLHLPPEMDGHPRYALENNETYVYEMEIVDPAGTYWFHPHPHEITGLQVYRGLAGLFIVSDQEEEDLNLPSGEFDLPMVIQDRTFDNSNQLQYLENDMMSRMAGFFGDTILINGKREPSQVATNAYRMRIINGSNARIYKLAWSDQTPLVVIGTDGGLLEESISKPYLMLALGERAEV